MAEASIIVSHRPGELIPKQVATKPHLDESSASNAARDAPTLGPETTSKPEFDPAMRQFGGYELIAKIAQGGMGVVYRARHVQLNRVVALKMILAGRFAGQKEVQRFQAEAEAAATLDHPGIVPIYEVGEHHGHHFFSMRLVEGESLADRLMLGPLEPRQAARCARKIADAIAFAHCHGVIHRDLKPANILLDRQGQPQVTDFGLAKLAESDSHLTYAGQILGTPSFMPPEQAAGKIGEVTESADVYSIGAILYALLTGRAPFSAESPVDTLMQVLDAEPRPPSSFNPQVPRALERICLRCLEKRPMDRYRTAAELGADLERFLQDEPVNAERPSLWKHMRRWGRRAPSLVTHLVGLAVILLVVQIAAILIGTDSGYHLRHTAVLLGWMLFSIGVYQLTTRPHWKEIGATLWTIGDTVFFTTLLYLAASPLGALLFGYALLIAATGFFYRVRLIVAVTAASIAFYAVLCTLRPELTERPEHSAIFGLMLLVLGGIVIAHIRRIKRLNQYFEDR